MSSQMIEKVVSAYRTLAKIPTLTGAKITRDGSCIISNWSQRNLETNKNTTIQYTQTIDKNLTVTSDHSNFGVDVSNEIASEIESVEGYRAVIRELTESGEKKKQYLEIWHKRFLQHSINLNALDIHGDVYADSELSSFSWNINRSKFMYVAERKLPKSEPFYKRQPLKSQSKTENDEPVMKGKEYDYKPEWGEQLVGKHLSSVIVCDVKDEICKVLEGIPDNWCPGQVVWSPDSSSIVGVAWETEPRRLGLIFCTNRPSVIFNLTLDGKFTIISKPGKAVRSPRFNQDGKVLIWLQRDVGGPHHDCHEIVKTAWPLPKESLIETIVDTVPEEITIEHNKKFTGVYSQGFPKRFSPDKTRFVFSTPQKTEIHSYIVNIETGKITDISDTSIPCCTTILDVHPHGDIILASRTSFTRPAELIIAKLPPAGSEQNIQWIPLEQHPVELPVEISNARCEVINLEHENASDAVKKCTALFIGQTVQAGTESKFPLIIYPHGGPHSNFVNAYSLETALYCVLGFNMIQVNYRGSTGAGRTSVNYLPDKAGDADVKDCILAMDKSKDLPYHVDIDKCVLLGRSHGGFLVTHLSGQYPDLFKAVVAGNPVIDIASMADSTDIPDWCHVEAGTEFTEAGPASEDLLLKMRRASPLAHADKVKAPTLMCLGSKDKRVPYYQGIEYYNKIRANGCKARMLIYEDNHALNASRNIEMDHIINSALWFMEHLKM